MNTCVIGVDSSTTATKVVAFDLDGTVISMSSCQIESFTDMPGRVEQDAARWWESLCIACRSVVDSEEVGLYSISGLAITHQRFTFVPVDDDLRPLRRAILWNDRRCAEEATYARSIDVDGSIYRRTGYPPGQWSLYKLLWLKNHEPALYEKTHRILLVHDYLAYHLTGELATSESTAAMTGALDIEAKSTWAIEVMEQVGVRSDVWVTPILSAGTPIGSVTMEASRQTGLPRGLPVIAGAGDQPCGSLGAGIVAEGQLGINGGTSCSNEFVSRDLPILERPDYFVEINPAGGYLVENDIPSGGSAVANWYRDRFHRRGPASAAHPDCSPGCRVSDRHRTAARDRPSN